LPQQYNDTGSYRIQLIMSYSGGCADTSFADLRILPLPNTFAGKDTAVCEGNSIQLTAKGADNYTWQPANFLDCINCVSPQSTTPDNIMYSVKGINSFGCEKTDSIFISIKKPFQLNVPAAANAFCEGQTMQLNASGAENYIWSPALGLSNATIANPVATPIVTTTYTVVGYDSLNCFRDTAEVFIEVYPAPKVNAGPDIISVSGKDITLSPQYSNDITGWLWQPSTGLSCTDCPNPVATPANGVTYTILVTNGDGCTASDNIYVQLRCDKNNIYMPTAFTPGSGSLNNIFYPLTPTGTVSFTITAFKIYNRTGELVFESGNFSSGDITKGWDGKYKGSDAPTGAYVYTVEFVCGNKQLVAFSGNILLIR
jgi:gliding motility-associated-like protein